MNNISKQPLADLIRPKTLEDFFGQNKIINNESFLAQAINEDNFHSMIFWGPPGCGKTTLAHIIAQKSKSDFIQLSATASGVKSLRTIIDKAQQNKNINQKTILFLDEIHRWNKAQQDALLPWLENGTITLIGATTENPSFSLNNALLSRTKVIIFETLTNEALKEILKRAHQSTTSEKNISDDIYELIANLSNGDARFAINTLEICLESKKEITKETIKEIIQKSNLRYDRNGEEHYNQISALHKSLRGNDPHASLYWLARMIDGGEDPLYITRRLIRFASEDIGLADNFALILANNVHDICHKIGLPECNTALAQLVIYLARAKKSIICYEAISKAQQDAKQFGNLPIPTHLRNAPTKFMKEIGYGKDYKYTPKENSSNQTYFPDELKNKKYF